MAFINHPD